MTDQESLLAAIHEEVRLHPYDPDWPNRFVAERARLMNAFQTAFLEIQHIGSTAVPGLPAKPIIDMLAGVESMAVADEMISSICQSGYTTSAEFNASLLDRRWFMRWAAGHRTHHLHVVVHGSQTWLEHLRFRDQLLLDPELAKRYAALKIELAAKHAADREAYTDAKAGFVRSALQGA